MLPIFATQIIDPSIHNGMRNPVWTDKTPTDSIFIKCCAVGYLLSIFEDKNATLQEDMIDWDVNVEGYHDHTWQHQCSSRYNKTWWQKWFIQSDQISQQRKHITIHHDQSVWGLPLSECRIGMNTTASGAIQWCLTTLRRQTIISPWLATTMHC